MKLFPRWAQDVGPLLVILLFAGALRLPALGRFGFWQDEIHSIYMADDLGALTNPLVGHAPLYYFLLRLWMEAGRSEAWVRGLTVLVGLLVVLLVYFMSRQAFGRRVAQLASWLVATSPVAIWASREARSYVLMHLLGLLAFWALLQARRQGRTRDWVLLGLPMAAALYTHYYALFMLASFGVVAFLPGPRSRVRSLLGFGGATILAFLLFAPWLPILRAGQRDLAGYAREVNRFATGHSYPAKTLFYLLARTDPPHMLGAAAEAVFSWHSFTALSLAAYLVLMWLLLQRVAVEGPTSPLLPWLVAAVVPTVLAVAGHYLRDVIVGSRYLAYTGLFLAVPTAVVAADFSPRVRQGVFALALLFGAAGAWPLYAKPQSEIREAVLFIDAHSREGDCVATVANKAFAYRLYSRKALAAYDLPWGIPGLERHITAATPLQERAIRAQDIPGILGHLRTCKTTWILYNEEIMWGVDMGAGRLRDALAAGHFRQVQLKSFYDTRVEAYEPEAAE